MLQVNACPQQWVQSYPPTNLVPLWRTQSLKPFVHNDPGKNHAWMQGHTSAYLENATRKSRHVYFSPEFLGSFSMTCEGWELMYTKGERKKTKQNKPSNLAIQVMFARMDLGRIESLLTWPCLDVSLLSSFLPYFLPSLPPFTPLSPSVPFFLFLSYYDHINQIMKIK